VTTIFDMAEFNERLFFPRSDASAPPKGAVDRMIAAAEDGVAIHLRAYPAGENAKTTILFFHGNGEVVADYDSSVGMFERAGARLIVSDYRGYGKSTGTPTLRAAIDDAWKVLDAIRPDVGGGKLVVMGRSRVARRIFWRSLHAEECASRRRSMKRRGRSSIRLRSFHSAERHCSSCMAPKTK
jgi:pimeloyl-ACP methyl ester carboxylesterase